MNQFIHIEILRASARFDANDPIQLRDRLHLREAKRLADERRAAIRRRIFQALALALSTAWSRVATALARPAAPRT